MERREEIIVVEWGSHSSIEREKKRDVSDIEHLRSYGGMKPLVGFSENYLHLLPSGVDLHNRFLDNLERFKIAKTSLDRHKGEESPVDCVIPYHLEWHDPGISKDRVLSEEGLQEALGDLLVDIIVCFTPSDESLTSKVPSDDVGDEGVLDGDEVAAGAVEWIDENAGVSTDGPPVA